MGTFLLRSFATFVTLGVTVGCSSTSTSFDWDRSVDFSTLRSWKFADVAPSGAPSDLTTQRVNRAVESVLRGKGHPEVDADPDFLVTWHVRTRDKARAVEDWGYRGPRGGQWTGYAGPRTIDVQYYEEGTLVVDVIDPTENRLIWRGTATRVLDRKVGPEQAEAIVRDAVGKIFAGFPPS